MKICQEQQKKQLKFNKKSIIARLVLCCLIFCFIYGMIGIGMPKLANAWFGAGDQQFLRDQGLLGAGEKLQEIKVGDKTVYQVVDRGNLERATDWLVDDAWRDAYEILKENTAIAYKRALGYFLDQLAYETATKLATGDWGQNPLIEHRTFKDVFKDAADNAAGYFIEDLGREGFGGVKFNLCEPDFAVGLKITLGLQRWHKPPKPPCTFNEMKDNWEEALQSDDFLNDFQNMFNPWENDLGIALSLQTQLGSEVDKKANEAGLEKLANQGFKPVTDIISGFIKTPASVVRDFTKDTIEKSSLDYFTYTGNAVADAIDVFMNTLVGKLIEEWLDKGILTDFPQPKTWDYDDYESQAGSGGIAGAEERFRKLIEPSFNVRGDYNILSELTMCPDPTKAGPTNCVITDNFSQAIINRMTVGQAMDQGYLNAAGIFGFTADGLEPDYYDEGYPYRSMIILRKFRILPVGWELAAQYIKDFSNETLNLGDLVACYDPSDDWDGYSQGWCQGLVDPNWVLKAPLNYCKREGPGPEIISEMVIGEGYDSELSISRDSNYCADEQSCIKENDDGSCQLYGYCTEERRKWQFNGTNCAPKYNTCQTFRSRASGAAGAGGNTVSYLENTLDYGVCTADNVGCKPYCTDYDFTADSWNCTLASVNDKLYFDKDAEECDQNEEGCHEFIRTKAGMGANFLRNSSFEEFTGAVDDGAVDDFAGWGIIGEAVSDSYDGLIGLRLLAALNRTVDVASTTHSVAGEIFSLSFYAKNCAVGDDFGIEADTVSLNEGSNWQYYQTIYIYPESAGINQVNFSINTASCVIDAIKLERGITATAYSDYRGNGLVYQKLAPDYLGCTGAASDPDECDNFVRKCNQSEVGCELYTSVIDDMSIPAKVTAQDYCSAECVGYDTYIQQETTFDSLRDAYFIPSTAQTCGAESAGCDEFTNLDEVAKGGEGIEYYSYLRQCVKPSDPGVNCAEFYTWEGSDETGFQLRLHSLEEDLVGVDGILNDPDVTSDDTTKCDAAIYGLPATDPGYNSDCREFYNDSGEISYHLWTRTISCDENCHPFRRTENNIDPNLDNGSCLANGDGSSKYIGTVNGQFEWDGVNNVCYFCKNRGEWSDNHQACLYMAVPDQGIRCSAGQNGCREYTGNVGNNMRIVLNDDFEGSLQGWAGINGAAAELSSTALMAGGESLRVYNADFTASTTVGSLAQKDKSYVLSFLAQSAGATQISAIKLVNGAGDEADFIADPLILGGWQLYKVNLAVLDHNVSNSESLVIEANGDFYIDDIRLTEITDRWYLIKNSWVTPDVCYEDILGNYAGPIYNLGCDEYRDRDNNTHFLHSFSQLCQESAVGCEIMIDTHNYSDYNSQTFNAGDPSEIVVPADSFIYAVYDRDKKCNSRDKGCQRLGLPYQYGSNVLYSDIYLKNNPDKYNNILCLDNEVGCEEWITAEGTDYFKDPGDMVCEWRQAAGIAAGSWAWQKKKVKRCDDDGNGAIDAVETAVCLTDSNCAGNISCILDNNDYACPASSYKTIGRGGAGNVVEQPTYDADGYWIGLCPASEAGCAEYIDPVSRFGANMLYNADFSRDVDSDGLADGWDAIVNGAQNIVLETRTLYVLAVEEGNSATVSSGGAGVAMPAGAVGYWRFDEGSGGTAFDSSGNGNNGTLQNMDPATDWVGGKIGTALEFDGADDYVDYGNDASLDITDAITIGAWFYRKGPNPNNFTEDWIGKRDVGSKYLVSGTTDIRLYLSIDGVQDIIVAPMVPITDNTWIYLVFTYDSATRTGKAYKNGEQFGADVVLNGYSSYIIDSFPAVPVEISDPSQYQVNGKIDEVAIYDRALSAEEIEDYYNSIVSPLPGSNDFYELNSNNNLAGPYNSISVTSSAGSRTSKRFYTTTNVSAKTTVSDGSKSNGSKVELKQAVIDYQLKQDVDKTTCNGIVDFDQGCVLFNQRNQNGISLAGLDWDADLTVNDGAGVTPDAGLVAERDANILLKVTPDRVCDKWLACRSYIKDEHDNNVCFDIGLCDSVDDNGNCNSFVITNQINQTYPNLISAELAGNMSGYVKAGYNNSSLYADYYPLGAMEQVGEVANVPNNGFEWAGSNGYPIGWSVPGNESWDENKFNVINNPIEAQVEGIGYAPEGRNFLKLGSIHSATSEFIDVEPGIDYILTAHINTINLSEGIAAVKVEQFNNAGNLTATNNNIVTQNSSEDWTFKLGGFETAAGASRVKITLHANTGAGTTGNFYFDDVKLRPALNSKANWRTPQTCRLYPQDDSLSCDYYEDSGKRQKGWLGYCLEYDRYPGSDNACLLWWPVDKVKGEGIEEGAGYLGKFPVYYCTEAEGLTVLEYRETGGSITVTEEWWDGWACNVPGCFYPGGLLGCVCTPGYYVCMSGSTSHFSPVGTCIYDCNTTCGSISGWYVYNGFHANEANYGVKFYDPNANKVYDDLFAYCTKAVQTVNSVGSNKYWSGRVYEGSDYVVPGLGYEYNSDYPPFGAIIEPYPSINPYEWDGSDHDGIQPLYVTKEGVRASHPYKISNISIGTLGICQDSKDVCLHIAGIDYEKNKADCPSGDTCDAVDFSGDPISKIKRLFAQSYGSWEWDGSHYMPVSGQDWSVPTNLCNGTGLAPRPGYPNDWCGIKPIISNIKANSQGGNIVLNNNQFINLTFNSKVNSQQLPLVMYAINWGDNEWTVVTGVEMRDRPNIDNPHSLYHLYSYWDLKAKHSVDQDDLATAENDNTIYCGDASASALNYNNFDSGYDCPASGACCVVKPSAKVKDNWGWCNNGAGGNPCPAGGYDLFGGWIVVKEK